MITRGMRAFGMSATDEYDPAVAKASALSALLQLVGYAIWQVAECEDVLAHWVVISLRPTQGIGETAAAPIVEGVQRKTFGQLMAELRRAEVLDSELQARVDGLLAERNWLVHHSKRESRGVLHKPDQFDALVDRLKQLAEEATEVGGVLGQRLEKFVVEAGVDPMLIEEEATRLAREWGYDDV